MAKQKSAWRIWAKALGEKSGKDDKESDIIAIIRTLIFLTYLVTNIAIVANAIRHWNDQPQLNNLEDIATVWQPKTSEI
jgi:hypothetical protein